jgi:Pyruvate/2-oxoacid:ferredoxin oxidoreductase delta subunit
MIRKIVEIDEAKCDGCGECVPSCAEGAIAIVGGKAKLVGDVLCDGLGACLGDCPRGAITVVEREAAAFDEAAVHAHLSRVRPGAPAAHAGAEAIRFPIPMPVPVPVPIPTRPRLSVLPGAPEPAPGGGCPGSRAVSLPRVAAAEDAAPATGRSRLGQWPVQLHLVPVRAPYFREADLLVAADCVPFAYARFHDDFLDGRAVVVGCPKLDDVSPYAQKLAAIIAEGGVKSVTVVRMEVPCCGGISRMAREAVAAAGRPIPFRDVVVGLDGRLQGER